MPKAKKRQPIDIVLPFANITQRWGDIELKYCLRSIEKHLTNYRNIYIIGDEPKNFRGLIHIPFPNAHELIWKEKNICDKVLRACSEESLTDYFLYFNDDHMLLSNYEADYFPYYYSNWPSQRVDMYSHTVGNTRKLITAPQANGNYSVAEQEMFFDVHCPCLFNKHLFKSIMEKVDWNVKAGYCMKTLYVNAIGTEYLVTEEYEDCKIRLIDSMTTLMERVRGRKWISTDDQARHSTTEGFLQMLFPSKSRYEL